MLSILKLFKKKPQEDPIAKKLYEASPEVEGWARKMPNKLPPYGKIAEYHRNNYHLTHELSNYETIRFVDDNDPEVHRFLRYLGFNPEVLEKAVVTIEAGKPVGVDAKGFAALERSNGSVWK